MFLPGESQGQKSLVATVHGVTKSWTWLEWETEQLFLEKIKKKWKKDFQFLILHVKSLEVTTPSKQVIKNVGAQLCLTVCNPWTVPHQAPLSMEFSRQEYWSSCHFLLQGIFLVQGWNSSLPCLLNCQAASLPLSHLQSPYCCSASLLCLSLSLGVCSNPCPLSQWCHPTISSFVAAFSCFQSFPASGSFQRVSSSHQVAKALKLQLQHQSFQCILRVDFL